MALFLQKSARPALLCARQASSKASYRAQFDALPRWKKVAMALFGGFGVVGFGASAALGAGVMAGELHLKPPKFPWDHNTFCKSLDHASIRRGYQVYKQVCAACHAVPMVHYRDLVDVCFTEAETKAEAAEAMIRDGPNDEGNMFERPGKLPDNLPPPYPNREAAKAANGGANPPDLTLIINGRGQFAGDGEDYVFSLLTGYMDPPAGIDLREGQHYNPYFPGGAIGMAQQLYPEGVEYDDGTPATIPQMAKDITVFLKWTGEFHFDERKRLAIKVNTLMALVVVTVYYAKRMKFMPNRNSVLARVTRK